MAPFVQFAGAVALVFIGLIYRRDRASFADRRVTGPDWRLGSSLGFAVAWLVSSAVFIVGARLAGDPFPTGRGLTALWVVWAIPIVAVIVVGAVAVLAGLRANGMRPGPRQVLIVGGFWTTVFGILLSLYGQSGRDVVYYYASTPGLRRGAAIATAAMTVALWLWWRRRARFVLRCMYQNVSDERTELDRRLHQDPGDLTARLALARIVLQIRDRRAAHRLLDGVTADSAELHNARAALAIMDRRWADALAGADAGLRRPDLDPDLRQRLIVNRAYALHFQGRNAEAVAAFDLVGPPRSTDRNVLYYRGLARLAAGDVELGGQDLRDYARDTPERAAVRRHVEAVIAGREPRWRTVLFIWLARLSG